MFELLTLTPCSQPLPRSITQIFGAERELPKRERYPKEVPATGREDSCLPTVFNLLDPAMGKK